ncbi:hypothetical protein IWQ62_005484 [Dispira parvispora]|uniref:Uncharacterized protein n=1 Tax=Dispira parvispora TaxID=1520584 RepID=A0A9W8AQV0_9FUNG|nr:hypothetical protein IWQ62_005484 [Dispira parvispora]
MCAEHSDTLMHRWDTIRTHSLGQFHLVQDIEQRLTLVQRRCREQVSTFRQIKDELSQLDTVIRDTDRLTDEIEDLATQVTHLERVFEQLETKTRTARQSRLRQESLALQRQWEAELSRIYEAKRQQHRKQLVQTRQEMAQRQRSTWDQAFQRDMAAYRQHSNHRPTGARPVHEIAKPQVTRTTTSNTSEHRLSPAHEPLVLAELEDFLASDDDAGDDTFAPTIPSSDTPPGRPSINQDTPSKKASQGALSMARNSRDRATEAAIPRSPSTDTLPGIEILAEEDWPES